jgi:hypothetical protein
MGCVVARPRGGMRTVQGGRRQRRGSRARRPAGREDGGDPLGARDPRRSATVHVSETSADRRSKRALRENDISTRSASEEVRECGDVRSSDGGVRDPR